MAVKNWGATGTFTGTGQSEEVGPSEMVLIGIEAGAGTVAVEWQPPESSSWLVIESLTVSDDVVKQYEAQAGKLRLNCTAYTSDMNYWLVER